MNITDVELEELSGKHYETRIHLLVDDLPFTVFVAGHGSGPSAREIEKRWEPDWGMDHVESEEHMVIANLIVEALKGQNK